MLKLEPKNLKSILVVDADRDFRLLVSSVLAPLLVLQAVDGDEAIRILKDQKVDMLITEFRLRKRTGVELLHWCRSNDIHVPVLFMSQHDELLKAEEVALADCCATMMRKPLNFRVLTQAVKDADERSHRIDCLHHFRGMANHDIRL